jgi:hypothetical protein
MQHPSTLDREIALWTPQREQRVKLEDVLTASRPVDHFAYFRRRMHAQEAAFLAEVITIVEDARGEYDGFGAHTA